MDQRMKELSELFRDGNCDYGKCRELVRKMGGCTRVANGEFGLETTPLYEAIDHGHYDFALELIEDCEDDLNLHPDDRESLIWELQYLGSESEELQWIESENKLRLIRALIKAGVDPDPTEGGENLIRWIRHKINEGDETEPQRYHLWQMEHIIEAHTSGVTERFFEKIGNGSVSSVMVSTVGFWLIDDNLCDCDHAVLVFDDGERFALSSYQAADDEWDFYAVTLRESVALDCNKYHRIAPDGDLIKFLSLYNDVEISSSHWLDLSIDDAILRIHADEGNITIGVVGYEDDDEDRRRRTLF